MGEPKWVRKGGEVIVVDDYNLFQNGSWIPNCILLYLQKHLPELLEEYQIQMKEETEFVNQKLLLC